MEFKQIVRFSLNSNCLLKTCPAYRIQSVHWKYHIGLFIHQETKKQGQNNCDEKGKAFTLAVGWEDSELFPKGLIWKLLLAWETFNSFQLDGIVNLISFGHRVYKIYMFMWIQKKSSCVTSNIVTKLNKIFPLIK